EPNRYHSVVVSVNGAYSTPDAVSVALVQPAIATNADGWAAVAPAHPGDTITIYLEGMGATMPLEPSGYAADSDAGVKLQPNVIIAGKSAEISYAGLAPGLVGVYMIKLRIPPDLTPGDLPVAVTQNGVTSNAAILPVR